MSASGFLVAAYVALVVLHATYLWNLQSRVKAVRDELERLEKRRHV